MSTYILRLFLKPQYQDLPNFIEKSFRIAINITVFIYTVSYRINYMLLI